MSTAPMRLRRCSAPNGRDGQNPGRHEFMAGARQAPVFGPVVVGDGGKYVQALQDIAVLIPPFDSADVYAALKTLRIAPLLDGVRGEAPLDAVALCAVVIALGRLIAAAPDSIAAIALAPVLVGGRGEGATVPPP